jgi:hypothetical protein
MNMTEVPLSRDEKPLPIDPATGYPVGYGAAKGMGVPPPPRQYGQPAEVSAPSSPVPVQQRPVNARHVYDTLGNDLPGAKEVQPIPEGSEDSAAALYPAGLNKNMIDSWKDTFGKDNIYLVLILERVYVFRGIGREEWGILKSQGLDQERFEEQLCLTTLLFPRISLEQLRAIPGGIASSLAEYVLRYSGFGIQAPPVRL